MLVYRRFGLPMRVAFLGGVVESELEEQFLSGSKRMGKYHLRQEEASRKKKVLVARYYRSTGNPRHASRLPRFENSAVH